MDNTHKNFHSVYVHIPFCERKCRYCSFAVAAFQFHHRGRYLECLKKEVGLRPVRQVNTLYIGGGTPSCLSSEQIGYLFTQVFNTPLEFGDDYELTFECNPEHINKDFLQLLKSFGVNRLSIGAQSYDPHVLKYLGRRHTFDDIKSAVELSRSMEFNNVSIDFMYGFKHQTLDDLRSDLDAMLSLECDHISLYSLNIEEGSRFYVDGECGLSPELHAEFYGLVNTKLRVNGFEQYEISNYSRPQKQSRHNVNYWLGGNYIGYGMSAHSHEDGHRYWNINHILKYMNAVETKAHPKSGEEFLSSEQRLSEAVILGLRMNTGIDVAELERKFAVPLAGNTKIKMEEFIQQGFLAISDGRLKATIKGRLVLDEISSYLL